MYSEFNSLILRQALCYEIVNPLLTKYFPHRHKEDLRFCRSPVPLLLPAVVVQMFRGPFPIRLFQRSFFSPISVFKTYVLKVNKVCNDQVVSLSGW